MLEQKREKFGKLHYKAGLFFSKFHLSPDQCTFLSLIFVGFTLYFLINRNFIWASAFFILAGICDFIDGAIAEYLNKSTKKGAYLDTICDRYVESLILIGFLFLTLPEVIFPSQVWISLAIVGSLMTTYAKAAAKEKGIVFEETNSGFLERPERIILIAAAIIAGIFSFYLTVYFIIILAALSNFTALQRIFLNLSKA